MDTELLCNVCADDRQNGRSIAVNLVCQQCFEYATTEVGELVAVRGKPQIRVRSEPFDARLRNSALPKELGKVVDISPANQERRSIWLLLAEDGCITRFDADTGEWRQLMSTSLVSEPDHKPWGGHVLKRRLHSSSCGGFAAIVNDYGHYGQIVDLRSGRVTLMLDGGDHYEETVPFSFAFAQVRGRVVAIHRTAWNRLDVSDPSTGALLTARSPTSYQRGQDRPNHYLDYFHGALYVSPNDVHIIDDGWVWHPVGIPNAWNLERWIADNVWESEDGNTRRPLCARDYYWDHGMTWLDDQRIAVGGLTEDDAYMVDGARIFDISTTGGPGPGRRADWPWPHEPTAFAGPAGLFFSDGQFLFSSDQNGFSRWDISHGSRTGYLQGFRPTHHHRGVGELVEIVDDTLVRWSVRESLRKNS
jgi:hypothetical protein